MNRYGATGQQSPIAGTPKTILELLGAATVRFALYDVMWGASGTPADQPMVYGVIRITATGTGTSVTPEALDPASPTGEVLAEEDSTVEPTVTGINLIEIPVNLRASYRWVAAPGGELVVAAVAGEGLAVTGLSSGYTGQAESTTHWIE